MHRYVELAHSMLKDNYTGLLVSQTPRYLCSEDPDSSHKVHGDDVFDTAGFGVGRTHEYHIPLQWLYENYPRNNSQIIWETMELMIEGGVLVSHVYGRFISASLEYTSRKSSKSTHSPNPIRMCKGNENKPLQNKGAYFS